MNSESIRKLRTKFTVTAMGSVAVVMFSIILIINAANYSGVRQQLKSVLDYLCENEGFMPEGINPEELEEAGAIYDDEFRYTTRFFTVTFTEKDEPMSVNMSHIAAVDKQEAIRLATDVLNYHGDFGSVGIYFYEKANKENGYKLIVFLDGSLQLRSLMRLIRASFLIFAGGLFITFWPVWIFSGRLIAPEIENIGRQKRFITNASHELKTPLAVIRANTELEEMMNGENEWTQSTLKQVERLEGLIANLVMLARASENISASVIQETDISAIIREEAEEFTSVAEKNGKMLICRLSSPFMFKTDADRLKQLVRILIDNAIKYCDDAGRITVELKKRGRSAQLSVSNDYADGKGRDFSHFFDRFYRQDSSHSTEKDGYGIGLAIARDLVKALKGRIEVGWKAGVITFTCHFYN